jgi:hypothetical protein
VVVVVGLEEVSGDPQAASSAAHATSAEQNVERRRIV